MPPQKVIHRTLPVVEKGVMKTASDVERDVILSASSAVDRPPPPAK